MNLKIALPKMSPADFNPDFLSFSNFQINPGLTGFDSKVLCTCKHAVRWIISTLI